ncbi:MAG: NADH-quinone oxidoreductase subunit J [Syntrophobacteraceae bacterium]|jgi:NADH-quinone oxidoreductase subunit J|nr:NADH-quinone oxidoreductase subunit J [Syntrophobacteraceae bacterium]
MTLQGFLFYLISAVIVASTGIAVTRRNLVHAVVYLILSFLGTALLFYLLGAPLLAALEVIIYAGAIMVLFLFVVIMIKVESQKELMASAGQWAPAAVIAGAYVLVTFLMVLSAPGAETPLGMLRASPRDFALYVFQHHWFLIEVVSLLLLIALMGALRLGKGRGKASIGGEA